MDSPRRSVSFPVRWSCFALGRRVAAGGAEEVAVAAKVALDRDPGLSVVVLDDETGKVLDLDFRGTLRDVRDRYVGMAARPGVVDEVVVGGVRAPGRPRLGVVAREVTLLPRHWEWLGEQSGGASVALRKLVEAARRAGAGADRLRKAQEACYRAMSVLAGDERGFEEASRALFAGDRSKFALQSRSWPEDVRVYLRELAVAAFEARGEAGDS